MILTLQFCYRSFFVPDLETGWCVCYTQGGRSLCLQAVFYRSSAYLEGGVSVIREPAGGSIQSTSDNHDDDYFRGDFLQRLTGFGNRVVSWRLGVGLTPLQLCYRTFQFPRLRDLQEHAGRFGHDNVPSRHFVAIYRASYHQRGASPRRLS